MGEGQSFLEAIGREYAKVNNPAIDNSDAEQSHRGSWWRIFKFLCQVINVNIFANKLVRVEIAGFEEI